MAKGNSDKTENTVDSLLETRQQLEEWIERLDLASEEVPDDVRARVRTDYEERLGEVLSELTQYADELSASLKEEVETREQLWQQEKDARDKMAEAQLRHTVGEYSDKQWNEIQAAVDETIGEVTVKLEESTAEISRLEDVLGAMKPDARKTADPTAPSRDDELGDSEEDAETHDPAEKNQTDAFDPEDLTFIKSDKSTVESDTSGPTPEDESLVEPEQIKEDVPRPSSIGVEVTLPKAEKTLKCGECGKLNFPTEWYCEHCGAELASL
jgi:hypothetical protein